MTIEQAINQVDETCQNVYTKQEKIRWLSRLDTMIKAEIIDTHEDAAQVSFAGYHANTEPDTVLLVPAPWDEIYIRYLEMQIAYANGEQGRYNNAADLYNTLFSDYRNAYNRKHMPLTTKVRYF